MFTSIRTGLGTLLSDGLKRIKFINIIYFDGEL